MSDQSLNDASPGASSSKTTPEIIPQTPKPNSCSFKDIEMVKVLSEVKFPVYHVTSNGKDYAMKLFDSQDSQARAGFSNEVRLASLNHPNIVKTVYNEKNRRFECEDSSMKASFILTEFAPNGDFYDFVGNYSQYFNEKLIRTYFHHLIKGLEFLHNQNFAHLDIKLENLLIGEDFNLRIADFDLSCSTSVRQILVRGTKCYRAPEMIEAQCTNGPAADIYSAGIFLFILKSGGIVPHTEYKSYKGIDLLDLFNNNNTEFWRAHCRIQKKMASNFSEEFKELVNGMMRFNPEERLSIPQIKKSEWYNGEIYTNEELKKVVQRLQTLGNNE